MARLHDRYRLGHSPVSLITSCSHTFLIIPSCPPPLLGRDILAKLGTTIHLPVSFSQSLTLPLLFLCSPEAPIVNPTIWDTETPLVATHHTPILIKLRDPSHFPSRPQFPISQTHLRSLKPIIDHLLGQGLLVPTALHCNTPILLVRKASGSYRLVQDLRLINKAVIPAHPIVPNPYTLPSDIPSSTIHFTVIDLKDAFFTITLHPDCQFLFAFTWTDPETRQSSQLTGTVLPQGLRDSPHFFWPGSGPGSGYMPFGP